MKPRLSLCRILATRNIREKRNKMATATEAKPIPVVNNVITDEEVTFGHEKQTNGSRYVPVSMAKTHKLLCDKHSTGLVERHLRAIHRLTKYFNRGFLMKDVEMVSDMLVVCSERLSVDQIYEKPLCQLIKICGFPFIKEKSSDESVYAESIINILTELGNLLRVPSSTVRFTLLESLTRLYCEQPKQRMIDDFQVSSLSYIRELIDVSGIARTLTECLESFDDPELRIEIIRVLQHYSTSALNCDDMLSAGAAGLICSGLNDEDPSGRLIFLSVEILWNLLEHGTKQIVADQLNCKECISALKNSFVKYMTQGYSHADRQLRNDLLAFTVLVADCCPDAPFVETGYLKLLVLFATFTEVKSHNELVRNLKLYQNHEDFELKKLMMNALVVLSRDPTATNIMSEGRVVLSLLAYVRPNDNPSSTEWSPAQFEELQLQALDTLSTIAALSIDDYMTCQGNTRLLMLLEWCVGEADYGGHGNSFYGSGGRGNKRAQMRFCLRLLRSMCSAGDDAVNQDMVDQGAIDQLVGILLNASTSTDDNDLVDIEMQCDMLFIVSTLCEGDPHRKELFGGNGVRVAIEYLKKGPSKINSPLGYHKLSLATVDCVWSAILGCYITEEMFLEHEGIFLLLDLLEICPGTMQNVILGCLVDLCENQKSLSHMLAWRGKEKLPLTVGKLLVSLWQKEETHMGVARDGNGGISDPRKPLMGALQERQGVIALPADRPSQAIVDVSENMRAKIFSLFCKIGFNAVPGLSPYDYVTVAIIEKYLDFKMAETWREIKEELEQENIRPVTPDAECLNEITKILDERGNGVAAAQVQLMQAERNQELIEEEEHYATIKENHRQEEKSYRDFCDYVNRTSDYSALIAAKQRQIHIIDNSRFQGRLHSGEFDHETLQENLQATVFCGRKINVESTPLEFTKTHAVSMDDHGKRLSLVTQ